MTRILRNFDRWPSKEDDRFQHFEKLKLDPGYLKRAEMGYPESSNRDFSSIEKEYTKKDYDEEASDHWIGFDKEGKPY